MTGPQRSELRRGLRAEPGKYAALPSPPRCASGRGVPCRLSRGGRSARSRALVPAPAQTWLRFRGTSPRSAARVSGRSPKSFLRRGCVSGAVSLERRGSSEPDEEVLGGGNCRRPGCRRDGGGRRPHGVGMPMCLESGIRPALVWVRNEIGFLQNGVLRAFFSRRVCTVGFFRMVAESTVLLLLRVLLGDQSSAVTVYVSGHRDGQNSPFVAASYF